MLIDGAIAERVPGSGLRHFGCAHLWLREIGFPIQTITFHESMQRSNGLCSAGYDWLAGANLL